ncbi:hypothetical protein GWI33_009186 [Rhynchophorus ferrugineus]|uniref:Uncharacterized protein n=1 Tax=Rhynchophorus ferrugineus TaxID=354439 RepID=A0A834IBT9_RHYFE|nr:hypothetical protein GWI33_009186 [Rhynchophorus ferrugineus]
MSEVISKASKCTIRKLKCNQFSTRFITGVCPSKIVAKIAVLIVVEAKLMKVKLEKSKKLDRILQMKESIGEKYDRVQDEDFALR